MIEQPELGQRIRKARKKQGLTTRVLGELSGLSHTSIADIETNRRNPRATTVEAICSGLNVSSAFIHEEADSAWDEWSEIMKFRDDGWGSRCDIWFTKYESDLKRIPSKE